MPKFSPLLLAALLAGAVATPAVAAPKSNPKSPQETSAYWTAERMKNAKPRERARPGGGGGGGGGASDWTAFAVPLAGGAYTGANVQNGKVFMTIKGGNYVCSGTAVTSSAGVNLVWTAGHCVTDGAAASEFATNFMFVPGYYYGNEPYGRWTFTKLDSTPGWEEQRSDRFRYDVGAAQVVRVGATSASLAATLGGTRPLDFGVRTVGERFVSYGYPAAQKFNGAQQYGCASPFRLWDGTARLDPMQISCNMTGGSSGGGWFLDRNANNAADAGEPLVSVNSYGYQLEKNTMYGPYLPASGQAQALYDAMD
jgi:V8-like Glu-specific endopeptidase